MIVIQTYYSDGSGSPELIFFPQSGVQASNIAYDMARLADTGKSIRIWEVERLEDMPVLLYPNPPQVDES